MRRYLYSLAPGDRFRLSGMPEVTGTLQRCSDCSAVVLVHGTRREVEFVGANGAARKFVATPSKTETWAPATVVEPITEDDESSHHEEREMSKTATKKRSALRVPRETTAPKARKAKAVAAEANVQPASENGEPTPKEEKIKKVSALDAAAQVLAAAGQPMGCKALIEEMAARGLWTSPGGKTPHATLYAAMVTEIAKKGSEARFKKVDRGQFTLNQ